MARHERSAGFILFRRRPDGTAVVADGGVEYLVLDYGRHWEYAKGHVEKGETDLDAAVRELREEAGITDPRVIDGFRHELVYFFRDRRKGLIRKTVIFFLAETKFADADVMLCDEHVAFAFLPFEAALKRVTFAGARQVLRAAHNYLIQLGEATPCPPVPSEPASEAPPHPQSDVTA